MLSFDKVQATGNDFIVFDARDLQERRLTGQQIQKLCSRHFGVGADGLILLASNSQADYRFIYFNADGSRGAMCGNGGRAGLLMAARLGQAQPGKEICFMADDGLHFGYYSSDTQVKITLNVPDRPIILDPELDDGLAVLQAFKVNTGVPHIVLLLKQAPHDRDIVQAGRFLRFHPRFLPEGTNVDFLWQEENIWHVRTYERGVEMETLSCGTGITACGLVLEQMGRDLQSGLRFTTPGGNLLIENRDNSYWLSGAVSHVFRGRINI